MALVVPSPPPSPLPRTYPLEYLPHNRQPDASTAASPAAVPRAPEDDIFPESAMAARTPSPPPAPEEEAAVVELKALTSGAVEAANMFSDDFEVAVPTLGQEMGDAAGHLTDNWDDAEGYYRTWPV